MAELLPMATVCPHGSWRICPMATACPHGFMADLPHGDSMPPWFHGGFAPWRRACSIATHLRLLLWATRTNLGRKLAWGHAGSYCILNTSVALEIKTSRKVSGNLRTMSNKDGLDSIWACLASSLRDNFHVGTVKTPTVLSTRLLTMNVLRAIQLLLPSSLDNVPTFLDMITKHFSFFRF